MKLLLCILLLSIQLHAAVSFVGVGTTAEAENASVTPTLHGSTAANDLILILAVVSDPVSGVLACPGGYTTQASWQNASAPANAAQLVVCSKIAVGGDSNPTVSYTGGAAFDRVGASAATFRGINTSNPINVISGTPSEGQHTDTIGPITAITPTAADGAVIVLFGQNNFWTSVATLTGDSLTWAEITEYNNGAGDGMGFVWDYALWSGSAPSLTDKTFTITGGGNNGIWVGGMLSLNAAGSSTPAGVSIFARRRR